MIKFRMMINIILCQTMIIIIILIIDHNHHHLSSPYSSHRNPRPVWIYCEGANREVGNYCSTDDG